MKLILVKQDRDGIGAVLPRWYGFAYRRYNYSETVLAVIPLNLIIRYGLKVYWRIYRWLKHDGWKSQLDDAYRRGYNDGNLRRVHHMQLLADILTGKIE